LQQFHAIAGNKSGDRTRTSSSALQVQKIVDYKKNTSVSFTDIQMAEAALQKNRGIARL